MSHEELEALISSAENAMNSGNWEEAKRLAKGTLAEGGDRELTRAYLILGNSARRQGNYPDALEHYTAMNAAATAAGDKTGIAKSMHGLGGVYRALSDYSRSIEYYTKALVAHEELGQKTEAARITGDIGIVYNYLSDFPCALEYYAKSLAAHEELGNKISAAKVTENIGIVYAELADYPHALEYYTKALAVHEELGNKASVANVQGNIGNVYANLSDYPHALEYYSKALATHEELGEKADAARVTGNIGNVYRNLADSPRALEYIGKALSAYEELGDKSGIASTTCTIGIVYYDLSDYSLALEYFGKALAAHEELGEKADAAFVTGNIGSVYADAKFEGYDAAKAEKLLMKAVAMNEELSTKKNWYWNEKTLAELYENEKRWEESLVHHKKYNVLKDEVQSEEAKKLANLMEQHRQAEEREKEIAIAKAKADAKHHATEQLLHNVLPPIIADKILDGTKLIAEKLPSVSVLFADIVNFTMLSQRITPEELVEGLDGIFSSFDALAEKYGLEKIKTIGDAYMVVSGAPVQRADHAEAMANFAVDMLEAIKKFRSISTDEKIQLRIGIHTGEVVAGVIGKKKFAYDLWGDAVNTASRMESHGEPGKIHCTEEFMRALSLSSPLSPTSLQFVERGEMAIKGKGLMKTYFMEKI